MTKLRRQKQQDYRRGYQFHAPALMLDTPCGQHHLSQSVHPVCGAQLLTMESCSALRSERGGSRREREQKYHCSLVFAMQFRPQDVMLLKSRGVSRMVSWVTLFNLGLEGSRLLQESVSLGGYRVSKTGETTVEL